MKRVETDDLESISSYKMVDAAVPRPLAQEVLVRIAACGIGYVDALEALGRYQVKPSLPHVPGQEVSGRIEAVGAEVSGLKVGDRVVTQIHGGFAELAVAPATTVTRIPATLDYVAAAGLKINFVTALHALLDRGQLKSGETLLVMGAAGGVGSAAVQVGKCVGAKVIAVASTPEKQRYAQQLGADHVIGADVETFREQVKELCGQRGPNVVFDPICGPLFEPAFRSLTWGGRHLIIGFASGSIPSLRANLPLLKGASLVGVDVRQFEIFEPDRAHQHLCDLLMWVDQGRLVPAVGREFAFEDYANALEFALSGRGLGKTVLKIADLP